MDPGLPVMLWPVEEAWRHSAVSVQAGILAELYVHEGTSTYFFYRMEQLQDSWSCVDVAGTPGMETSACARGGLCSLWRKQTLPLRQVSAGWL